MASYLATDISWNISYANKNNLHLIRKPREENSLDKIIAKSQNEGF
jgi:hypothetical protein